MIGRMITFQSGTWGLLTAPPNWDTEVKVGLELPTDVSKEPITFNESRRVFAQSARYKMSWTTYLGNAADSNELRLFLTRVRGETILVPLWPDACELLNAESVSATAIDLVDLPVRYGTNWIIANDDFSTYELLTITNLDQTTKIATISPGLVNAWPAGTLMYPLLAGRFDERPQVEAISDEMVEAELTIKENSQFAFRVSPASTITLSTVGSNISTFSTTRLWDMPPNFVRPLDWTEMPDVVYEHVGFLREEQQRAYDHRNPRGLEFEFYQNARADLAEIEFFWRDRRGTTLRFMVPTFKGDLRLMTDTPNSPATLIRCEKSYFSDGTREAQPGDPYVAFVGEPGVVTPTNPIITNLISYWTLDEASGTRTDSHTGGNNLTDNNTVLSGAGKINNAADFERDNSEWLSRTSNASLITGDIDFTIACWVKLESKPAGSDMAIVTKMDGTNGEYSLQYTNGSDRFTFKIWGGAAFASEQAVNATALGSPAIGTWYFIVAWFDSVANTLNIKVNNGTTNSLSYAGAVYSGSTEFRISNPAFTLYLDGLIDEAGLWKRVLTTQEQTDLYNGGSGYAYPFTLPPVSVGGIDPYQVTATDLSNETQLNATVNVTAHTYINTNLSHLLLARFSEPTLEWSYITPYLASTRIKFQELPHEYASPPAALTEPAYLFIFIEAGIRTDRYTSYENTITIPSGTYAGTYVSAPFSFDTVKTGLRLDQESLEFKSFKFTGNPLNKMWPFALDGILTLEVVEVDAVTPSSTTAVSRFYGDVWSVDSSYKATAVPFGNLFDHKFPRFLLSVSDNYVQFSTPTGISAGSFVINGTVNGPIDTTSQTITVNSSSGFAKAADYFAGGWLETGTGVNIEKRGILSSAPATSPNVTVYIDRPLLKAVAAQACTMYPGYDGSISQCDTRFSNRINFGGHAYIPNINPTVKAIKPKDSAGGKKL